MPGLHAVTQDDWADEVARANDLLDARQAAWQQAAQARLFVREGREILRQRLWWLLFELIAGEAWAASRYWAVEDALGPGVPERIKAERRKKSRRYDHKAQPLPQDLYHSVCQICGLGCVMAGSTQGWRHDMQPAQ